MNVKENPVGFSLDDVDRIREKILDIEVDFFEFAYDRHLIYHKKTVLGEPAPWTDHPVLHKMKFCNSYRFLDRGTIYIYEQIEKGRKNGITDAEAVLNIIFARFFNRPDIFDSLGGYLFSTVAKIWTVDEIYDTMVGSGMQLFSNAYLISQHSKIGDKYHGDKTGSCIIILKNLLEHLDEWYDRLTHSTGGWEGVSKVLQENMNIGPFLAGQIMIDMSYHDLFANEDGVYSNDGFLIVGPGAAWGVDIMYNNEVGIPYHLQERLIYMLRSKQVDVFEIIKNERQKNFFAIASHDPGKTGIRIDGRNGMFSVMDIQHLLCEYRKYCNWTLGKGKKRYYKHESQSSE